MVTGKLDNVVQRLRKTILRLDGAGLSDGQLLDCFIAERDEAAFEALVRRHGPMVMGVCQRLVGHFQDAEDAFQATFIVLSRNAAAVVPRESVGNWLYGVAYRIALRARATRTRRRSREKQVKDMPHPQTETTATWRELEPLLDEELNRLPDKYRLPIVLCDLEGRTRRDVARQLNLPDGTLSNRLATGRRLLAKRLRDRGFVLAGAALAAALSQNALSASGPAPLVVSTVNGAIVIAVGRVAASGVISAKVAALAEGVLRAMFLSHLKVAGVALLLAAVVLGTVAASSRRTAAGEGAGPPGRGGTNPAAAAEPAPLQPEKPAEEAPGPKVPAAVSSDKKLRAAAEGNSFSVFDAGTGRLMIKSEVHTGAVTALAFSPPASELLASGSADKTVLVSDLSERATGRPVHRLKGHAGAVTALAFSPDGKTLASGGADKTVRLWDSATGKEVRVIEGKDVIGSLSYSADGRTLTAKEGAKGSRAWDPTTGKEVPAGKEGP